MVEIYHCRGQLSMSKLYCRGHIRCTSTCRGQNKVKSRTGSTSIKVLAAVFYYSAWYFIQNHQWVEMVRSVSPVCMAVCSGESSRREVTFCVALGDAVAKPAWTEIARRRRGEKEGGLSAMRQAAGVCCAWNTHLSAVFLSDDQRGHRPSPRRSSPALPAQPPRETSGPTSVSPVASSSSSSSSASAAPTSLPHSTQHLSATPP